MALAPPFARAEFEIGFGQGIDREAEVLDRSLELGLIERSGSWFSCGETRIGQGRNAALIWLRENVVERDRLLAAVRASFGARPLAGGGDDAIEELEAEEVAA